MASLNKVQLIGYLGRDPETRYLPDGMAVTNISIATSESWKDKQSGEKRERTEWHRISAFDKLAEIMGEYLKKGSQVYVEGSLRTRKWDDKDGVTRYSTEIRCDRMLMLGPKTGGGERPPIGGTGSQKQADTGGAAKKPASSSDKFSDMEDDIPF